MNIDIITVLPAQVSSFFEHSIIKNAINKNLAAIRIHDLREYGQGNYRQIDDYQYGGGAGMVLMAKPLAQLIEKLKSKNNYDEIIYLTPDGETLTQKKVNRLSLKNSLMMICGHYKGIDQRIRDLYVSMEISIGDYVLTGGELAAATLSDAIIRLIPGVINDETSALTDSFQDNLLAPPVYTRPAEFKGLKVPEVLLSGHEKNIQEWRLEKAIEKTKTCRPDILDQTL